MSLSSEIKTGIGGYAGLATLISTRLTPGRQLPQGSALPAVTYWLPNTTETQAGDDTRVGTKSRIQFSCWALSYLNMLALAAQVEAAILAFSPGDYSIELMGAQDVATPDPESGYYLRAVDAIFDSVAPATVTIFQTSSPANAVTVYTPTEDARRTTRGMETVFNSDGLLVAYVDADGVEMVTVRGATLSVVAAERIATWADADELLSYTDRAGTTTTGWRVLTSAPPNIKHAPSGTDWILDMRLWRIP